MQSVENQLLLEKLGVTGEIIQISSRHDYQIAIQSMAEQARQRLLIFTRDLDATLFDQAMFVAACKLLVLRSARCHIHILVQNSETLRSADHRLVSLMQRLPSRIELRICHPDHQSHPEQFVIADNSGLILQRVAGRLKVSADFNTPLAVRQYNGLFESIWDISEVDSTLRRLNL